MTIYKLIFLLFWSLTIHAHAQSYQNSDQKKLSAIPVLLETSRYPNVRDFTLSSSGNEAYFTILSPNEEVSVIVRMTKHNDRWLTPELVSFTGKYRDLEPFLSPDGLRLYFASNRPSNANTTETKDFDIWYVERKSSSHNWSVPVNPGAPVNSEYNEFFPSVAKNNNLYFTSDLPAGKGKDDIYLSRWKNGMYEPPVTLSDSINTEGYEFNAFIAPDESFLIFSGYNRKDGFGSGDLYISYNRGDAWSTSLNLGETINSGSMDYCPFVDGNTMTLYFTSKRSLVSYSESFKTLEDFLEEINKYPNGFSRLYRIPMEAIPNQPSPQSY